MGCQLKLCDNPWRPVAPMDKKPIDPTDQTVIVDPQAAPPDDSFVLMTPAGESVVADSVGELTADGRYELQHLHARGGMGDLWFARDVSIERGVALKELRTDRQGGGARSRFLREARITAQLEHPGIVPVYEMGHDQRSGQPYYTMRFIHGQTLTEAAEELHTRRRAGEYDRMELVNLLTVFVSVCNTVGFAHSKGVVHRDLKGSNIVLGEYGEVVVIDWGLAKRVDLAGDDFIPEGMPLGTAIETMMGQVMGTPSHMAPELANGRLDLVGPATDIFGLGAILYEILTGQSPYQGDDTTEVLSRAARATISPPHDIWPEVSTSLENACLKALARDPSERFSSAREFGAEVQSWQDRKRKEAENQLRDSYRRLKRQQDVLIELTHAEALVGNDLVAMWRHLCQVAAQVLDVERVSLWRFTPDRSAIRCDVLYELSTDRFSTGQELTAKQFPSYFKALTSEDVIAASDAVNDPRTREFADAYLLPLGISSMMEVPIHTDGILCNEHVGPPREWLPDEQTFAIAIGNIAALALSHWQRNMAAHGLESPGLL